MAVVRGGFADIGSSGGTLNLTTYTQDGQYFYNTSNAYYTTSYATYANTSTRYDDAMVLIDDLEMNDSTYVLFNYNLIYQQYASGTLSSYYKSYGNYVISEALVIGDITINLKSGTTITNSVYGGGNNGAVTGDITINVEDGATIGESIYGGGAGLSDTIYSSKPTSYFNFAWTSKTEIEGSDTPILTTTNFKSTAEENDTVYVNAPADGGYSYFLTGTELKKYYLQDDGYIYIYSDTIKKLRTNYWRY